MEANVLNVTKQNALDTTTKIQQVVKKEIRCLALLVLIIIYAKKDKCALAINIWKKNS